MALHGTEKTAARFRLLETAGWSNIVIFKKVMQKHTTAESMTFLILVAHILLLPYFSLEVRIG